MGKRYVTYEIIENIITILSIKKEVVPKIIIYIQSNI